MLDRIACLAFNGQVEENKHVLADEILQLLATS
jgi:hypothetical protein